MRGIETFEVPAVIGLPAEVKVYASEIFLALRMFHPPDYNLAGTYSIFYLVVASIGVGLYLRATASAEKYATITGKGYRPRTLQLGRWRYLTLPLALGILFAGVILPFLIIALTSVLPIYKRPSWDVVASLSLDYYRTVLRMELFQQALFNNIVVAVISATAAVVLGAAVTWVGVRTKLRGRKLLDIVAFTPMAFPGIVIRPGAAVGLSDPAYSTLRDLVDFGDRLRDQIRPHSAARLSHRAVATPSRARRSVDHFGLILAQNFCPRGFAADTTGVAAGWFYVLALTFKALSLPVLLSHLGTEVLPVVIYGFYESGDFSELSALGVILIGALSLVALGTRIFATQFSVHERSH